MRNNLIVRAGFKPAPTLLAAALALAMAFTLSCSSDDGNYGDGTGPGTGGPLIGKWYSSQSERDECDAAAASGKLYSYDEFMAAGQAGTLPSDAKFDQYMYWFKSGGTLTMGGGISDFTYTATATQIKATC